MSEFAYVFLPLQLGGVGGNDVCSILLVVLSAEFYVYCVVLIRSALCMCQCVHVQNLLLSFFLYV